MKRFVEILNKEWEVNWNIVEFMFMVGAMVLMVILMWVGISSAIILGG